VYDRKIDKQTITLQVSGMLWQRSLVMRDLETESLWSHLLGRAMQGKLKGTQLEMLPAAMTTWKEWQTRHPKTTVLALPRTVKKFRAEVWKNPTPFVYGIQLGAGQAAPAVSIPHLQKNHIAHLKAGDQTILVTYSKNGHRVQAFNCQLNEKDEKTHHFTTTSTGLINDLATQSSWDPVTGKCVEGKFKGRQLKVMPGTISFQKAWKSFFPDAHIIK
jgi:hypothetical protein